MKQQINTAQKGARHERQIINEWVLEKPEKRIGIKCAGSMNKGKTKIDGVLIDLETREILVFQAKNAKDWPQSRKDLWTTRLKQVFDGDYKLTAKFL